MRIMTPVWRINRNPVVPPDVIGSGSLENLRSSETTWTPKRTISIIMMMISLLTPV